MPYAPALLGALILAAMVSCASPRVGLDRLPARPLDRCGAGVAAPFAGLDLAIAIDTSTATSRPSGSDVDADGTVGEFRNSMSTDAGDSLLAAQVAAVKSLVRGGALSGARVSVVGYAGRMEPEERSTAVSTVSHRVAQAFAPLTSEPATVEGGLARVLAHGSRGAVDLTAAVQLALRTLRARGDSDTSRRRVILLLSHSPTPILGGPTIANFRSFEGGDPNGPFLRLDPDLVVVARRAIRHRAVIHSFGLGGAAEAEPPHPLSGVARVTGGTYRAVADPSALDCALLAAVSDQALPGPRRDG